MATPEELPRILPPGNPRARAVPCSLPIPIMPLTGVARSSAGAAARSGAGARFDAALLPLARHGVTAM